MGDAGLLGNPRPRPFESCVIEQLESFFVAEFRIGGICVEIPADNRGEDILVSLLHFFGVLENLVCPVHSLGKVVGSIAIFPLHVALQVNRVNQESCPIPDIEGDEGKPPWWRILRKLEYLRPSTERRPFCGDSDLLARSGPAIPAVWMAGNDQRHEGRHHRGQLIEDLPISYFLGAENVRLECQQGILSLGHMQGLHLGG